jgi:hypothetical protein
MGREDDIYDPEAVMNNPNAAPIMNTGARSAPIMNTPMLSAVMNVPTPSAEIGLMSVYQPFPLRIEGQQYDACFQIGEFAMPDMNGIATAIVVLVPLKVSSKMDKGAKFINAFASSIPNILGGRPDRVKGYPDVQVTGLTSWNIADIMQSEVPFYTWTNKDGTRVIVMADAVGITEGDMLNIKSLPITPPGDAIQEISDRVYYRPAAPVDCAANPMLCRKPFNIIQPAWMPKSTAAQTEILYKVLAWAGSFLVTLFVVWLAINFSVGSGAKGMAWLGNKIGSTASQAGSAVPPSLPEPALPSAPRSTT